MNQEEAVDCGCQQGKEGGKGQSENLGWACTHCCIKMENQHSPAVEHEELCSMSCGSLDGRGVWGRMDTCLCMAESLCCSFETVTMLLNQLYSDIKCLKKREETVDLTTMRGA